MTLAQVKAMLDSTGLPVVYYAWPEKAAPPLPWICYMATGIDPFYADGEMYKIWDSIRVELYTDEKSPEIEAVVENALRANGLTWNKTEEHLDDEKCVEIIYEIEV